MSNLVRYGEFSLQDMESQVSKTKAISGGAFMDLEQGENIVRFLPPLPGQTNPFRTTKMHYIDAVPGLEKMIVFACLRAECKRPCIACSKWIEWNSSSDPDERAQASRLAPGLRIFANVIDRKHPESGVRVLGFGTMIMRGLETVMRSSRSGGNFTDPTNRGFDIIINREGSGRMATRYTVMADRDRTPLAADDEELDAVLQSRHDLEQFVRPIEPEELLRIWGKVSGRTAIAPPPAVRQVAPTTGPKVGAGLMSNMRGRSIVTDSQGESDDDFPESYSGKGTR